MQIIYSAIKAPQWYAVQGSDTTMMTIAASLFGQLKNNDFFYPNRGENFISPMPAFFG